MKFKDKKTGTILIPTSKFMIDKMKSSNQYEEIKEEKRIPKKTEK